MIKLNGYYNYFLYCFRFELYVSSIITVDIFYDINNT